MFHPDTHFLIDHWSELAQKPGVRAGIPDRKAFAPEALGARLPRAFIAERVDGEPVLRLAGTWVEAFHGEPLKDVPLLHLWRKSSRALTEAAVTQTSREARPVVIIAQAGSALAPMEVVLAPLRGNSGQQDLVLGLYAPAPSLFLHVEDNRLLTARITIGVGDRGRAALSLAAVDGRRTA